MTIEEAVRIVLDSSADFWGAIKDEEIVGLQFLSSPDGTDDSWMVWLDPDPDAIKNGAHASGRRMINISAKLVELLQTGAPLDWALAYLGADRACSA